MSFTTSNGNQVYDDTTSMTAGSQGPVLMQDVHLLDKLAHFNRERIPERVVHAKGAGAHGYFEVTHDITKLTKARFLSEIGKRTPIFARFSRVAGESGAADSDRDPRGFAVKFYTEEGNWDMVGNNTPVFFLRDSIKFPDFIHTQKRNPQTHLKDPNMFWDFLSLTPESIHQVTILFSNRGTPDGYRHMNGYFSHTLQLVNEAGERCYVKWHFKTCQGIRNLKASEATRLAGEDPDYATRDLFDAIERGEHPSWLVKIQVMPLSDVPNYRWNPLDVTKVWPHKDYPLQPVGRMVLDRNPTNYFAEVEQAAFAPSNMVSGIEPTADRMLQGRILSYHDAHLYRLGVNYKQLPINQTKSPVKTYQQDGAGCYEIKKGPNYAPNSLEESSKTSQPIGCPFSTNAVYSKEVKGELLNHGPPGRYIEPIKDDDFVQAGDLFRMLPEDEKADLISNIAGFLGKATQDIQHRMVALFEKADPAYGKGVKEEIAKCS
ncbi:catalase A [Entomophthora muscae]|uniref:Catalase A n=1 Tax=Entomophthora muscae TaxID=34485 RepID=A0ACC2TGH1_9FUNG|nr:catalase A [Entomophthora muscae]